MRFFSRPHWYLWLLGVVLLVGTAGGAGWMLNRDKEGRTDVSKVSAPFDGEEVWARAWVDVEDHISRLYPLQPGVVKSIAKEGKVVEKGEVLLQLEDQLAQIQLAQAKIALADAEKAIQETELLRDGLDSQILQQEALVEAAQLKQKAVAEELHKAEKLFKDKFFKDYDVNKVRDINKQAGALVRAAQEKLKELKEVQPRAIDLKIARAKLDRDNKQELVKQAEKVVADTRVVAPARGTVLRVHVAVGDTLGGSPKMPAIEFCPDGKKILRAEVQQEWADKVKVGQDCVIEDDTTTSPQWKGKITSISKWFTHRRSVIQEPFQFNDVRTLECVIEITSGPNRPLRIGQRMRVAVHQGGP
jgi:multidrug resistance efflux pump